MTSMLDDDAQVPTPKRARVTQAQLAALAGISPQALRELVRELEEMLETEAEAK